MVKWLNGCGEADMIDNLGLSQLSVIIYLLMIVAKISNFKL